ncbi:fimbrial major subunit CsuA/B family protein [Salinisphaera sp. USBA-960]|uniref:Csu type fimbrial protein n=1 Tax=Salinisphaera orenii TaxID=856731 RepID=UPI000DBE8C55|nr:fimbrial major subunit CsuA/B family protein [Salifodinibacter halophilus]NNC25720.1 fimbrial major subunit CsuA/B family protein [Salifodinibacter halophilus]
MKSHLQAPAILISAASSICAGSALAATESSTMNVSARVDPTCTVYASIPIRFQIYAPNDSSPHHSRTSINASCTKGTEYELGLGAGKNSSHSERTTRAMSDGNGHYLSYELYLTNAYNTVWKDIGSDSTAKNTAQASSDRHVVYGQIPPRQFITPGQYSDTVNVTLKF